MCFREEADEYIDIGALNGIFVLGRSMGFIGKLVVRVLFGFGFLFVLPHGSGIPLAYVASFFFFFWLSCTACKILVPQAGSNLGPNHWTTREFPRPVSISEMSHCLDHCC